MGTLTIGSIIDTARATLLELTGTLVENNLNVRWDRTGDLLAWANNSFREIATQNPDAYEKSVAFELATGSEQVLPDDAERFLNVTHNLGADGETPGRAINLGDRMQLSRIDPNWLTTVGTAVEIVLYDQRESKIFYAYPQVPGPWYVRLKYQAATPTILAANVDNSATGAIPVDDNYAPCIHDYIVGYALLKNTKVGDTNKAAFFLTKFYNFIGKKFDMDQAFALLDPPAAEATPNALGKP